LLLAVLQDFLGAKPVEFQNACSEIFSVAFAAGAVVEVTAGTTSDAGNDGYDMTEEDGLWRSRPYNGSILPSVASDMNLRRRRIREK
jgi:hypothetical protein